MKNRFTILGTGWLGLPLALALKEEYEVKVSIRSFEKKEELVSKGLKPYILNENNLESLDELLTTDILFINFPPSKFENFFKFLDSIYSHKKFEKIKKVIFVSSTSIYPDEEKNFNEDIKFTNPKSQRAFDIEEQIKNKTHIIFRCAGLMGANRIAGKYYSGKTLDSEDVKVNYVHLEDIIKATSFVVKKDLEGIFNLCSKEHPTRKEVYSKNAKKYGFKAPIFKNKKSYKDRLIDGSKIQKEGFRYKYPNPLEY